MNQPAETTARPRPQLSLWDAASIIVGIIIGSGIFQSTPTVARSVPSEAALMLVWALGGLFALAGALCYAELSTAWTAEGGDLVYLSRGYGSWAGFIFAWAQLWIIRPGSVGVLATVFANYAQELWNLGDSGMLIYALGSTLSLTVVNLFGLRRGAWTQNVLSAAKIIGLLAVVVLGLLTPAQPHDPQVSQLIARDISTNWALALIFVLFAYSGWHEMPIVAAEVRDPKHNLFRALLLGTASVAAIYLLVNYAMVHALGLEGLGKSHVPAADVAALTLGDFGRRFVAVLVCVSTLGALNGMTLTGSRLYYALGCRHARFAWLGRWDERRDAPTAALALEAILSTSVIVVMWWVYAASGEMFDKLVAFTAPIYWLFLAASISSLFVLRVREPDTPRPFRVPLYPVLPLVVCLVCAYMVYAGVDYAWANWSWESAWSLFILSVGAVLAWLDRGRAAPLEGATDR
ncbi:MAG: amino acid permease [Planctomycetes bacterium]|nr:amino acid permease [Planctomycetota bacterium]